ncbi:hypothetical protein ACQ86N_09830 [Puia sp. P3]|uniref:hypothetical protein n=1 Tax=Puia sp. P3 TaxID=3423952 RepID=UPI003D66C65B
MPQVVLLPEDIGVGGRGYQDMRVVADIGIRIGQEFGFQAVVADLPAVACVRALKYAGAADADMNVIGIPWVDDNGVYAGLVAASAHPICLSGRVTPEGFNETEVVSAVVANE